jgi:hypothetical protein
VYWTLSVINFHCEIEPANSLQYFYFNWSTRKQICKILWRFVHPCDGKFSVTSCWTGSVCCVPFLNHRDVSPLGMIVAQYLSSCLKYVVLGKYPAHASLTSSFCCPVSWTKEPRLEQFTGKWFVHFFLTFIRRSFYESSLSNDSDRTGMEIYPTSKCFLNLFLENFNCGIPTVRVCQTSRVARTTSTFWAP